jgi:hypothetical protein
MPEIKERTTMVRTILRMSMRDFGGCGRAAAAYGSAAAAALLNF